MQKKESPDFRFPDVGISGYVDTQLPLLSAFLPSVALKPTHRHIVCFLCCLKCILKRIRVLTKWIRGYVVTQGSDGVSAYQRIHLSLSVALGYSKFLALERIPCEQSLLRSS